MNVVMLNVPARGLPNVLLEAQSLGVPWWRRMSAA